jgi:hypothetical protein
MARPARRARSAGARKDWSQLADDTRRKVATELRAAALETLDTLQEIGPAYSGEFRESWEVKPAGRSTPSPSGVPTLIPARNGPDLRRCGYTILNEAPHAPQALDLEPGKFVRQEPAPIKTPVVVGTRVGRMRGAVIPNQQDEEGNPTTFGESISTAERDWYRTYAAGGGFADDVQRGLRIGRRQAQAIIANRG